MELDAPVPLESLSAPEEPPKAGQPTMDLLDTPIGGVDLEGFRKAVAEHHSPKPTFNFPTPSEMREARNALGIPAELVAQALGTNRYTILKWEQGAHRPSPRFAARYMILYNEMLALARERDAKTSN